MAAPTGTAGKEVNGAPAEVESNQIHCIIYGLGIIVSLGIYGVIQEKVMTTEYDGEKFKTSVFLVLCNRLWGILYAIVMAYSKGESFTNKAPLWKYLAISFSSVGATTCQYEALKYVSFPVQMLGKSFKMMPVMLWSILISGKKYKADDWLIAAGVTGGVVLFLMTGSIAAKHVDAGMSIYGLILLLGFLGADGFTSTFQEKLFKEHKTSKYNQMVYVNLGSAVVSISSLLIFGGMTSSITFCLVHPIFFAHAMSLSAAAVTGQFFIYSQVKEFGAVIFAATMNLRQIISILISYMMNGVVPTILQFVALCLVFGALFGKTFLNYLKKKNEQHAKETQKPNAAQREEAGGLVANREEHTPQPDTVGKTGP